MTVWKPIATAPRDSRWFAVRSPTEYDVAGGSPWWIGTARFENPGDREPEVMRPNGYDAGPTDALEWAELAAVAAGGADPRSLTFISGNRNKIAEYASYGFAPATRDIDLREVKSEHRTVAVRKAEAAGPMTLIEDTALDVEGAEVGVNVRWMLDRLPDYIGRRAITRVILATNDGITIRTYEARCEGRLVNCAGAAGFGYDPIFAPDGFGGLTMAQLDDEGRKGEASARAKALRAMLADDADSTFKTASLAPWKGAWQKV